MPHTLFSLNYDVLTDILSYLAPQDATQLALASRAAYALALPRIVSDVTLGGLFHKPGNSAVAQLTAFCNFLLSPAPAWLGAPESRLDALQNLSVMRDALRVRKNGIWTVDPTATALLSTVIARARNLQKLTLWGSDVLFAAYPDFASDSSPSIHTLVLGGDVPSLPVLAHAFPHVRTLEFIPGGGSCAPDWAIFTANQLTDATSLGAWQENIDHIDTGYPVLPLACPVRRVDLRNPLVSDTYMLFCAREFLRRTRPVVLSASVSADLTEEEMSAVLDGEVVAPGLRFLELEGDRCKGVKESETFVTNVANTLSALKVPILGLSLSVTPSIPAMSVPHVLKWGESPEPKPAPPAESLDLMKLARTVAEHARSLRFLSLDLSSAPGAAKGEKAWFRVYDAGSKREVERISEAEGREVERTMRAFNRWD
ncbi:hypothetical protein BN946_scf184392.g1 [Trametes cinnabarina]|uniref:F-box domain-containing protein n=1 Tax=Pycnoporus cinnabarinus TaxID=5643 RepID=A0A060SJ27_PYCCI|nr:hypothetical protein BN946_scf184392.g1 [Trametes cinnabarina]